MASIVLPAPRPHHARVVIPGDKSISHRVLMFAAIARGTTSITGLNLGADVRSTAAALRAMGVPVEPKGDGSACIVHGTARFHRPQGPLDCGNSGTAMRMLAGLIAARTDAVLDGDASLRRRPMERVAGPLRALGADVRTTDGHAPIEVRGDGARLRGRAIDLPVASAQLKTAVLLAGLDADGITSVSEPSHSRDHTELLLREMGADVGLEGRRITVCSSQLHGLDDYRVPADLSAAFFFVAGASVLSGASITLPDVGINPTRTAALDVVRAMGADVDVGRSTVRHGEPSADITVRGGRLSQPVAIDGDRVASLIDEVPALCALAAASGIELSIRGAAELRTKESDRISTTAELLAAFGAATDELPDGIRVRAGTKLKAPIRVTTHGDHRIGMSAAILALAAGTSIEIDDAGCIETSFPGFAETWARAFT